MIRQVLPGALLASIGASAASLNGNVYTRRGDIVADATATIYNADNNVRRNAASDASGRFRFNELTAGQYILRIEKTGMATVLRELAIADGSHLDKGFVMVPGRDQMAKEIAVANGQKTAAQQVEDPQLIRIGSTTQQTKLIKQVPPIYPPQAKRDQVQGPVKMEVTISQDGIPVDISVVSSPSDELSESAVNAVRQWQYSTTLLNGQPVAIVTEVTVTYSLSQ